MIRHHEPVFMRVLATLAEEGAETMLEKAGGDIVAAIRSRLNDPAIAPVSRSGALADSIATVVSGRGVRIRAGGPGAPYAPVVELGGVGWKAMPFLRPVLREREAVLREYLVAALRYALRRRPRMPGGGAV